MELSKQEVTSTIQAGIDCLVGGDSAKKEVANQLRIAIDRLCHIAYESGHKEGFDEGSQFGYCEAKLVFDPETLP